MIKSWKRSSIVLVSLILLVYLFVSEQATGKDERRVAIPLMVPPIHHHDEPPRNQPDVQVPVLGQNDPLTSHPMWPHNLDRAWQQFSAYYNTLKSNCSTIDVAIAQGQSHTWDRKFFFYQCQGMCGGFGDRLRGALTVFYLAVVGGNCFGLDWGHPVGIDKFFDSLPLYTNAKSCRACRRRQLHAIDNFLNIITPHSMAQWATPSEEIIQVRTNSFQWHQIVNSDHFKETVASNFPYLTGLTPYELAHLALRLIFSNPSELVTKNLDALRKKLLPGALTIGVQVRLNEGRYGPSDSSNFKFQFSCITKALADLCVQNVESHSTKACSYFMTGDLDYNEEVVMLEATLKHLMSPKNISVNLFKSAQSPTHLDRVYGGAETHLKTFADWEFLKEMHVLMISRSGFGETAAWYSRAPTMRLLSGKNPGKFQCNFKEAKYGDIRAYLEANDYNLM
jgi:hypothetical protein